jgi:hypothetical protein
MVHGPTSLLSQARQGTPSIFDVVKVSTLSVDDTVVRWYDRMILSSAPWYFVRNTVRKIARVHL